MASFTNLQEIVISLRDRGNRPAIISFQKDPAETFPFAELAHLAMRFGQGLAESGLEPGSRVVLFAPNRPEWIVVCLGLIYARAVPVPLDAQIGGADLQALLGNSDAQRVCTIKNLAHRVRDSGSHLQIILLDPEDADGSLSWRRYLADSIGSFTAPAADDLAVLFYTSGTSGVPKGVPLTHRNVTSNVNALLDLNIIRPDDRVLLPLPLHHVYPFTVGMLSCLAAGVPIILPRSLTGKEFMRALQEGAVTAIVGVPGLYRAFYDAIRSNVARRSRLLSALFDALLSSCIAMRRRFGVRAGDYIFAPLRHRIAPALRLLASGGAAMERELALKLDGLGWRIVSGYGLTETSPILTFNTSDREKIASAGRPLPGVELRIAKREAHEQFGEVLARGPNVFSGYWRMPDKNKEAFTADGYFRTGDLGYMDQDGFLYLVGRVSSMIVLPSGENIQPERIERVLEGSPHIREAAVLSIDGRVHALIVPETQPGTQGESIEDLIAREVQRASNKLPTHHRISGYAITRDPLPRTRIGKIRRHMLPELYQRAKGAREMQAGAVPIEQMTPEDQELLRDPTARKLWEALARRYPEVRLAPETDIRHGLGIDSMDWLNLTMHIYTETGAELDDAAIGRIETVRDLLREASRSVRLSAPRTDPLARLQHPKELLDASQLHWIEPPNRFTRLLGRGLLGLNRILLHSLFRLEVRGRDRLPQRPPLVLVPNHASYLDPLALAASLPSEQLDRTYWGGWTGIMFANVFARFLSRAVRVIPVAPEGGPLTSIALAVAVLQEGNNLVWFPEGGRSHDGRLQRFRPGIGLLTAAHPVTLVPVSLQGTYEALPPGRWWPRPCRITVTFGTPIQSGELQRQAHGDYQAVADALRDRVAELAGISNDSSHE